MAKDCYQLCLLWCLYALCKTLTELFLVALCGSPIIDSHMTHVWYTNGLINMVYFLQLPLLTCIWVLFGVNDDKWWYIFHGSICLQVIQSSSKSLSPRAVGSIAFGCTFRSFRPNQVIYDDGIWWMYLLAFWDQGNTKASLRNFSWLQTWVEFACQCYSCIKYTSQTEYQAMLLLISECKRFVSTLCFQFAPVTFCAEARGLTTSSDSGIKQNNCTTPAVSHDKS